MKKIFTLLLLVSQMAIATFSNTMVVNNFNYSQFQQCQTIIKQCPMTGPFRDDACIKQKLTENTACKSLSQLSQITYVQADLINAKQFNNLFLITLYYPADGKNAYGFLSPAGDFISAAIDLKKIDKNIASRFQQETLMLTPLKEPRYQHSMSGKQQFILTVRVSKNCMACQTIGIANIGFSFDAKGKFMDVELIQFVNQFK